MPTINLAELEKKHGLPLGLLGSVMRAESGFNPQAVSPAGALGLMQFMPDTAREYGINPMDPLQSILGGAEMLGGLNRKYGGDLPSVLAAYNWGQGNVDKKGLQNAPSETRSYISKILSSLLPISTVSAAERVPTREEFLMMKQSGKIPLNQSQNANIPTREEFLRMKQAETPPTVEQPDIPQVKADEVQQPEDFTDILKNMVLGLSARGTEAMTALNPFANKEDIQRVQAEKAWVDQHKGAGVGQVLGDILMTAPVGGIPGAAGRALAVGAIEGATTSGNLKERLDQAALSTALSGAGEGIAKGISKAIKPIRGAADDAIKSLLTKAEKAKIPLSAADRSNSKAMEYMSSALDALPTSSGNQRAMKEAQHKAWTRAIMNQVGENADNAGPETMGALKDRLSAQYKDIASRNVINIDEKLIQDLSAIRGDQLKRVPTNQKGIVKSYLDDFLKKIPRGRQAQISASTYQDMRSMLDKQARSMELSDPATANALRGIRESMDSAMERSVSPEDFSNLMQTNKEWGVMRLIEKSVNPTTGEISPNKFMTNLAKRGKNSVLYGKGDQTLNDLARIGKQFVGETLPDSGTAQRAWWTRALTGAGLGALGGAYTTEDPRLGAGLGFALGLGVPYAASKMLWSPNGYLSKGLIDMEKTLGGVPLEKILTETGRYAGTAASR